MKRSCKLYHKHDNIVTGYGVAERKPDNGSWIREFDLFGLWV
jgi:hypothetical protein